MSALSVRRPLSVLAVLAMIATLLFAVAGTASAATVKPSDKATFSACPDNASIPDAGFTDIPTASFFDDAVNCLAYYTVTTGTTPTTYGPGEDVTRAQMAVFLYRMAGVAGVVLDSTPPSAGFTDISELSAEAQTAINALADKGIVKGKTATTYAPADSVWRQQMALFLKRFSDAASAPIHGPGGVQAKATTGTTTNFTDLGAVTVEANTAIIDVFHLGVAAGNTATTFDPLGNVNRGQMALFLTRLAAHMNVRPAGVNLQATPATGNDLDPSADGLDSDMVVTFRSATFMPVANTLIDQFAFPSTDGSPSTAFAADGSCVSTRVAQLPPGYGPDACEIDAGDEATDGFGNGAVYNFFTPGGDVHEYYAWTGSVGSDFDVDTTTYSMVTVTPTSVADGYTFKLDGSTSTPGGKDYEFGKTATWVIQVTDNGKAIAQADWEFTLATDQMDTSGVISGATGVKLKTDASGQIVITKSFTDPDKDTAGDSAWFQGTITADEFVPTLAPSNTLRAEWNDADAVASTIKLSTVTDYEANKDGAGNAVTALVTDQFGDPVSGIDVCFTSTNDAVGGPGAVVGIGDDALNGNIPWERGTNSAGKAVYSYEWDWASGEDEYSTSAEEIIDAYFDVDGDGCTDAAVDTDTHEYYWAKVADDTDTTNGWDDAIIADMDNDAVVTLISGDLWYLWFQWDSNDTFLVEDAPNNQAGFEAVVDQVNDSSGPNVDVEVTSYDPEGFSSFNGRPPLP